MNFCIIPKSKLFLHFFFKPQSFLSMDTVVLDTGLFNKSKLEIKLISRHRLDSCKIYKIPLKQKF